MEDITLLTRIQRASYPVEVAYDYFCDEFENAVFFLFGIKETMEAYGQTESEEKELLRGILYSAAHLIYMHARLDAHRAKLNEL